MEETEQKFNKRFPIRPVGDRFVGRVVEGAEESSVDGEGDFILPKSDHSKPMKVQVTEISDEFANEGLGMKVGDIVLLPKYGSTSITYGEDGEKYQLCNRLDIIGIL